MSTRSGIDLFSIAFLSILIHFTLFTTLLGLEATTTQAESADPLASNFDTSLAFESEKSSNKQPFIEPLFRPYRLFAPRMEEFNYAPRPFQSFNDGQFQHEGAKRQFKGRAKCKIWILLHK